ncbi:MAG: hypothetical protein IT369_03585 [Candidatus Latescibacteria bacterium]|nr:hypothetical protein [Candidatus Latescibacterota bacterium]
MAVEDQGASQKSQELINRYRDEAHKFIRRAAKEIDETPVTGGNLRGQASVCQRLLEEIEETKEKREAEVEELWQNNFEQKVKWWRAVRRLAIEAEYVVEWIVHRREKGGEFKRAGADVFKQRELYTQIGEGDEILQQAREAKIARMNRELDAQLEKRKKQEERQLHEDLQALKEEVAELRRSPKVSPEIETPPTPKRAPADPAETPTSPTPQQVRAKVHLDPNTLSVSVGTKRFEFKSKKGMPLQRAYDAVEIIVNASTPDRPAVRKDEVLRRLNEKYDTKSGRWEDVFGSCPWVEGRPKRGCRPNKAKGALIVPGKPPATVQINPSLLT